MIIYSIQLYIYITLFYDEYFYFSRYFLLLRIFKGLMNTYTCNSVYSSNIRNKKLDKFFIEWIGNGEVVYDGKIAAGNNFLSNRKLHNFRSLSFPRKHGYHFVLPSIWPISVGCNIMLLMLTFIGYTNTGNHVGLLFGLFFNLILLMSLWFKDVIEEGFMGYHTVIVQRSLRLAMILFILSEALFFVCFFWAYYHNFLSPDVMILSQWPPFGIRRPCAGGVPLLNTVVLLSSGVLVTWSRIELRRGNIIDAIVGLEWTVFCGYAFTVLQLHEYKVSDFGISDTVYGSTFFMLTGFHGFHVIIGTILLIISACRCALGHFAIRHHTGFICAIWYWHFVDAIWIFVYFSLYVNVPSHIESIIGLGTMYVR